MPVISRQEPEPKPTNRAASVVKVPKGADVGPSARPVPHLTRTDADDLWGDGALRILLYGQSGTGKTRLWATFPGRTLALICSGGSKPGELRSIATPENKKRITPKKVDSTDQLKELIGAAGDYDNVVLDHASGLQDLILMEILGLPEIPAQRPVIGDNKRTWGEVALRGKEWFRTLLNLPGNIIIVAQERTFGGDEETRGDVIKPSVGAALTPSLSGWLAPACDYVVETFKRAQMIEEVVTLDGQAGAGETITKRTGKYEFCLRTGIHDYFQTKMRCTHNNIPDVIVDPSYSKLMKVIRGEKL